MIVFGQNYGMSLPSFQFRVSQAASNTYQVVFNDWAEQLETAISGNVFLLPGESQVPSQRLTFVMKDNVHHLIQSLWMPLMSEQTLEKHSQHLQYLLVQVSTFIPGLNLSFICAFLDLRKDGEPSDCTR